MTIVIAKTKAEQQFAEALEERAINLPGDGWMRDARKAAIGAFATFGLPSRRNEAWKYTDLRMRLKEAFPSAQLDSAKFDPARIDAALGPALAKLASIRLVFVNGMFYRAEMPARQAPGATYIFDTLAKEIGKPDAGWMRSHFSGPIVSAEDSIVALNTAFASDGAVVTVAENAKVELPIHLIFVSDSDTPSSTATRNLIEIGNGAAATILESHVAIGNAPRQSNAMTEVDIQDSAQLHHLKIVVEGSQATHVGTTKVKLGAKAEYHAFQLTSRSAFVRNSAEISFNGQHARFDFSGIMLAGAREHIDTTMVIRHEVPNCTSRELVKAVLGSAARAVFQGKVIVAEDAQKSDGKQMAQALLLAEDAEFDSKPELEIYADDVVCGHGSTSAEIDEDLLFYCQSRGIPKATARALLIEAFVGEAIDKIENESIRAAITELAAAWLHSRED